jgi:hypothetical protein
MEKTDFANIQNVPVRLVYPSRSKPSEVDYWSKGQILIKRGRKVVGFVQMDDLFDGDGNYFNYENVGE